MGNIEEDRRTITNATYENNEREGKFDLVWVMKPKSKTCHKEKRKREVKKEKG